MKKIVAFFLAGTMLAVTLFAQKQAGNDVIEWDVARQLSLGDFSVIPDQSEKLDADHLAITRTGVTYTLKQKPGAKTFELRMYATMHPGNSFIRQKVLDGDPEAIEYLLRHEQRHFDISEIFARKAVKQIKAKRFSKNYAKEVNNLVRVLFKESEALQRQYDAETRNGRDGVAQKLWDEKIDQSLKRLEGERYKTVQKAIY